ncbi:GyrI-like domain-containing protein [Paenibacillus chungangensis]|uniref:GyrI-like domain-containing protein n=1 Tax=Paenibacillus chungangensis TaxID=696535 RepID=A0ABW3HWU6_9BACL
MQKNEAMLVTKQGFQAVGLVWSGTLADAEAGGIRAVIATMQERLPEIEHVLHPDKLLGLSYMNVEGGFTHYAVVEVEQVERIPAGMRIVTLPTLTYAKCEHKKGQHIDTSYSNIFAWIEEQGYKLHKGDVDHFEQYPMQQDPYDADPEFLIMIPVETPPDV